jgi:hypothetical protein
MQLHLPTAVALAWLAGCASLRGSEPAKVSSSQAVLSAYWFRGVPRSLEAVTQGDIVVDSPLATGGTLSFATWFNMQLTNRTGDAAFPDGHGGESTEVDLVLDYTHTIGPVLASVGGIGYQLPEVGPTTKEAFVRGEFEAVGLQHALTAYYDLDLLDDFYLSYQAADRYELDERWSASVAVLLGYMRAGQSEGYFSRSHSGFSDLMLSGALHFALDPNVSLYLRFAGVTVPDDELARAADALEREDSGLWVALGAAWGL